MQRFILTWLRNELPSVVGLAGGAGYWHCKRKVSVPMASEHQDVNYWEQEEGCPFDEDPAVFHAKVHGTLLTQLGIWFRERFAPSKISAV